MSRDLSGRRIAAAAIFLQVFALSLFRIHDPDTWWHLKTGEVIWTTHAIPVRDIYSWVIQGRPWVTFEWLSQLLFYAVFKFGGAAALTTFKALIVSSAYLLAFELGGASPASVPIYAMSILLVRGFFYERPQIFDLLLIPVFIRSVENKPGPRLFFGLPLLEALWANLHGGAALLGAGIVGLRGIQAALQDRKNIPRWAALAALCGGAVLVNAHGYRILTQLLDTMAFPGKELIQEWRPIDSFFNWYGIYLAAAFAVVSIRFREEPLLSMLALVFGFMAARSVRYMAFSLLVTCPLLARSLGDFGPFVDGLSLAWGRVGEAWRALREKWTAAAPRTRGLLAAASIVALTIYYSERMATYSFQLVGFGLQEDPKGAVDYIDRNDLKGRMFNEYGMGGYLIWREWPKRLVFADGRNVEYGPAFVHSIGTWMRPGGFASLDAAYHFDYAIAFNGDSYNCWELDRRRKDWALVYWDDAALVYLRRTPANAALIARDEYKLLQPNHLSYGYLNAALADAKRTKEALAEIERAIRSTDANVDAHQMKAYFLAEQGKDAEALASVLEAVRRFPYKPGPELSLGWYYERTKDLAKAAEAYRSAADLAHRDNDWVSGSVALNNWGTVEWRRGDREKARALYRRSLELNSDLALARDNLRKLDEGR